MEFVFDVASVKQIEKRFRALPRSVQNKAIRPAVREGAKVIKAGVVRQIKSSLADSELSHGLMERSVIIRPLKMKRGNIRVVVAYGKGKSKKGVRVGLYASVREYGKRGQAPNPTMRTGARDAGPAAVAKVISVSYSKMSAAVEDAKRY